MPLGKKELTGIDLNLVLGCLEFLSHPEFHPQNTYWRNTNLMREKQDKIPSANRLLSSTEVKLRPILQEEGLGLAVAAGVDSNV